MILAIMWMCINVPVLSNIAYRFVSSKADYPGITDYVNVHEVTDLPAFDLMD